MPYIFFREHMMKRKTERKKGRKKNDAIGVKNQSSIIIHNRKTVIYSR